MSYRLNKPYTEDERFHFIIEYHLGKLMSIEETDEAMFALEKNEIMQDGEPIVDPDYDSKQLQKAKEEKIAYNDQVRDEVLLSGITYSNVLFDSDTDQKINLTAKFLKMSDTDTVVWYGMDNKALLCTKQDLFNIGQLIDELHSFCWENNAYIKEQIQEAQTMEELEAIIIDYTMPEKEKQDD